MLLHATELERVEYANLSLALAMEAAEKANHYHQDDIRSDDGFSEDLDEASWTFNENQIGATAVRHNHWASSNRFAHFPPGSPSSILEKWRHSFDELRITPTTSLMAPHPAWWTNQMLDTGSLPRTVTPFLIWHQGIHVADTFIACSTLDYQGDPFKSSDGVVTCDTCHLALWIEEAFPPGGLIKSPPVEVLNSCQAYGIAWNTEYDMHESQGSLAELLLAAGCWCSGQPLILRGRKHRGGVPDTLVVQGLRAFEREKTG
ncbi:unnamed protein product [Cyprideis torosa]|uniref:Uncharacterized protein n=1 Tax=Cyprideis torosa TaxID=163714 RepID=A0A7R8ZK82_9CRUS|nr:unnamed protein product [Cyprideis torosa]CAG0883933.1 unnamed protein product [Cyprideis torosa]